MVYDYEVIGQRLQQRPPAAWKQRGMFAYRPCLPVADDTNEPPLLIGVTVLTSLSAADLAELGLAGTPLDAALRLARLARACGLDGVVCSAQEAAGLRREFGTGFRLVTPGIRPANAQHDDQQRVMTPRAAIASGADYLVVGRPITQAPDPLAALREINSQI